MRNVGEKYFAPQAPGLVIPGGRDPREITAVTLTFTANDLYAGRAIVPVGGTLDDLSVFLGATALGTGIGVVYGTDAARTQLWAGAAVVTTSTNAWVSLGNPALAVEAGDQIDLGVVLTNATCTIGTFDSAAHAGVPNLPAGYFPAPTTDPVTEGGDVVAGASNILAWMRASQAVPATTQPDGSITAVVNNVAIIAKVTPSY